MNFKNLQKVQKETSGALKILPILCHGKKIVNDEKNKQLFQAFFN